MGIFYYPLALKIKNSLALVIGGGKVAERKVQSLLKSGVRIKVISPQVTQTLLRLSKQRKIRWVKKQVCPLDLNGADIIIAATSDQCINKKVSSWARQRKILVNVVDQANLSDFISPAVLRANKAMVTVYTNGKDPVLSRDLKNFLKENWDEFISYRHRLRKRSH